ncbi:MAG: RusA family crossover junction endodeoxyribonuclease [Veillonellaceae bacterium]|nr:RusA family crossover junction endodeoxyribonuclease [Veillonellaceae bacterium]
MAVPQPEVRLKQLVLEVEFDSAPPSDNTIYWGGPHGRKILTKEGKAYKNGIREAVTRAWQADGMPRIERDMMLELHIWIRLPHVFTRTKEAQGRFVKVDVHNRGKVLIDAIAEALGFDDSQHFRVRFYKVEGTSAAFVRVFRNEVMPTWPEKEKAT